MRTRWSILGVPPRAVAVRRSSAAVGPPLPSGPRRSANCSSTTPASATGSQAATWNACGSTASSTGPALTQGPDPLHLAAMFGLDPKTAIRYAENARQLLITAAEEHHPGVAASTTGGHAAEGRKERGTDDDGPASVAERLTALPTTGTGKTAPPATPAP